MRSMPDRDTAIVVPVWNAVWHTRRLLRDLLDTVPEVPVVFVDNASHDGVQDLVRRVCRRRSNWTYLRNDTNLGFTAAINQGMVAIGPGYDILLLNSDIRCGPLVDGKVVLDDGWLDKLSAWLQRYPEVGIVAPRLQNRFGGLCGPDAHLADDGRAWLSHVYPTDRGQYTSTREVRDVQHACVLKSAESIAATGLLEERMVIYRSDSYDCRMTQAYAKQRVLVAGDVTMTHWIGASRSQAGFNEGHWAETDQRTFLDLLPAVNAYRGVVNVSGPFGEMTGYSKLCENMSRALHRVGCKVLGQPLRRGLRPDTIEYPVIADIVDQDPDDRADTLIVCPPHEAHYYRGRTRTCATMFECWQTPRPWVPILNGWERCWTFSDWNQQSFEQAGVTAPISVVPVPLDTDLYHPELRPIRLRQARDFNILTIFEWGVRKWPESILQVCEAFAGHDDVAMVVRANGHDGPDKLVRMLETMPQRDVPIITPEPVPEYDMGSFYRAFDLVIAVGAEGIGLLCLEALACGVPAIALNWGAGAEFGRRYGALMCDAVGERDVTGLIGPLYDGATIGIPDFEHLRTLAWSVYEDREGAKSQTLAGAARIATECNLSVCGQWYAERLLGGQGSTTAP